MDTIVVFIETHNQHANLVWSLEKLSIPYVHLYEGMSWVSYFDSLRIYSEGLKQLSNEWVLLSDARDVLFYKGLKDIHDIFIEHYSFADIVIQAEDTVVGCLPFRTTKLKRYSFGSQWYKYPCAGLIMGRRITLIEFFDELIEKTPDGWNVADQPAIEWGMANLTDYNIVLDSQCRIFQQMGMGSNSGVNFHLHFNREFIRNTHTNTEPCIFHGSGGSFLHPVWRIINGYY